MASHAYDVAEIPPPRTHKPKRTNRVLGDYTLSKTLGAGSMGKVKLATHNITGEKLAVKILPRARVNPAASSKEAAKEAGKEVRTLREAGLSLLLHHPYICGMREMIVHPNHYYMVFEYVNGGQLLDFIIAHGRLRESVARKFARQIASALDYCHRNNVVHRDLKIENILISQTGNIKIIDFGLSNLYDPASHLSTFCGSLYFAAPELLNAKLYTGPEVDVWSFGVVLYTLVCGKVPFEDESMPALHAKIKRGLVEYPVWLSPECKHLLSRMLVTNPPRRALLSEIFLHPWMLRGFSGPPATHLPTRTPLRPNDIDPSVVAHMAGFDFGADVEEVTEKLHTILMSDEYATAVLAWEHRRNGHAPPSLPPLDILPAPTTNGNASASPSPPASPTTEKQRRRFSGLDFYKRIFTSPSPSPSPSQTPPTPPPPPPRDPTGGFHPLVSMYFLAREKIERERVYGVGVFASSQVSLGGDADKGGRGHEREETAVGEVGLGAVVGVGHDREETAVEIEGGEANGKEETGEPVEIIEEAKAVVESPVAAPLPVPETVVEARAPSPPHVNGDSPTAKVMEAHSTPSAPVIVNGSGPSTTPWPTEPSNVSVATPADPPAVPAKEPPAPQPEPVVTKEKEEAADKVEVAVEEAKPSPKEEPSKEPSRGRRERGQTFHGGTTLLRRFGSIFIGAGAREDKSGSRTSSSASTGTQRRRESKRTSVLGTTAALPPPMAADEEGRAEEKEKTEKDKGEGEEKERASGSVKQRRRESKRMSILSTAAALLPPMAPDEQGPAAEKEKDKGEEEKERASGSVKQRRRESKRMSVLSAAAGLLPPMAPEEDWRAEKDKGEGEKEGASGNATTPAQAAPPAADTPGPTNPPSTAPASTSAPSAVDPPSPSSPTSPSTAERAFGSLRRRATTILDPATRAARHERRSSTGASIFASAAGTVGRVRRSSLVGYESATMTKAERMFPKTVPENDLREHPEELSDEGARDGHVGRENERFEKESKPVFLKGLLSVATTSTKPPPVIKADIRRVLDRMQVRYWQNNSGFECIHLPSINVSSLETPSKPDELQSFPSSGETAAPPLPNGITKRVSRLSFSIRRVKSQERNFPFGGKGRDAERPLNAIVMPPNGVAHQPLVVPDTPRVSSFDTTSPAETGTPAPPSSFKRPSTLSVNSKLHSVSADLASPMTPTNDPLASGELDRVTFETMAHNALSVRFEINIVKVPWLPLHGIQFRRAGGDGWQYQMLARRVLTELKL